MQQNTVYEDEIDLKEVILTLWSKRKFIAILTALVTLISLVYTLLYNPKPVYKGESVLEIGGIHSIQVGFQQFDDVSNLAEIINTKFEKINTNVPKRTNTILEISVDSTDKKVITTKLSEVVDYILDRHQNIIEQYDNPNYIMTEQIKNISISNSPINQPKKKLIVVVAFVTGLILSIFLVFFIDFIKSLKEEGSS